MGFLDDNKLGTNTEFIKRTKIAILKSATAIAGEDPGSTPVTTGKREALALSVFNNPQSQAEQFALLIASLGTITPNVTIDPATGVLTHSVSSAQLDSDIEFTVNAVWNDKAGVKNGDA